MTKHKLALIASVLLGASVGTSLFAADAKEDAIMATALQAEEELTKAIAKSSAAFVFVGGGSGVLVSPDGYILTNHHVAGDRKQWTVRVEGTGRLVVCDLVGTDPVGDLALLKARDAKNLPFVEFGEISKVRVGQQVLAVGDPFKLADLEGPPSVSIGTVSALHRFQGNYSDAIQTDSAVNPGNSGGPLLTLDSKLIGITGQIMSRFGAKANTGIGYAIPIDQILRFYPLLQEAGGRVVYHGTLPEGLNFSNKVDETQSATIEKIDPDSEGLKAGFKDGDRIISVDGKTIYNYARLLGIVRSYPENTSLDFKIDRGGKEMKLTVKLPRMQLPPGMTYASPLGVRLQQMREGGPRVTNVERGSAAARAGFIQGDVITTSDGKAPSDDWQDTVLGRKPGEQLTIHVLRKGPSGQITKALLVTVQQD